MAVAAAPVPDGDLKQEFAIGCVIAVMFRHRLN